MAIFNEALAASLDVASAISIPPNGTSSASNVNGGMVGFAPTAADQCVRAIPVGWYREEGGDSPTQGVPDDRFPRNRRPIVLLIGWASVLQRRRGASGRVRPVVLAAVGVAGLVVVPATAWASPPDHGTFSSHEVFVDSEVCAPEGFSVDVVQDEVEHASECSLIALAMLRSSRCTSTTGRSSRRTGTRSSSGTSGRTPSTPMGRRGRSETRCTSRGRARDWSNTMRARSCSGPMDLSKRSTVRTLSLRARRSASLCCRSRRVRSTAGLRHCTTRAVTGFGGRTRTPCQRHERTHPPGFLSPAKTPSGSSLRRPVMLSG